MSAKSADTGDVEVELTDGSVLIRPYREADEPLLYAAVRESIPEVSQWLPWCHENYSIEESLQFISSREIVSQGDEWYSFAVFYKDEQRFLGGVGLNFINRVHQVGNLGYWCAAAKQGKELRRVRRGLPPNSVSGSSACNGLRFSRPFQTLPANVWPKEPAPFANASCASGS